MGKQPVLTGQLSKPYLQPCLNLEPGSDGQGPSTQVRGLRTLSRGSWALIWGLLGLVAGSDMNWFKGWGRMFGVLRTWQRAGY